MRVLVFTSGRQDWNILEPVARCIQDEPSLSLVLVAGGAHFRDGAGPSSLGGLPVDEWVDAMQASDSDLAVAQSAGWTTALLAGCLHRCNPQAMLVVGDRTETLAAATAAVCLKIPLIHLHGGEETLGAIDNSCRHAISKLASLHFVAHASFAERLLRMGEPRERVFVVGAPGLDQVFLRPPGSREDLALRLGVESLGKPLIVFTHHPTTLGSMDPAAEIAVVLSALECVLNDMPGARVVMTQANADGGGNAINRAIASFAAAHPKGVSMVRSLGDGYFTLLKHADLMVGNSSSGIVEAATFSLPVVDIGERQAGRLRGANVLHADLDREGIRRALLDGLSPAFRKGLAGLVNPYGDGRAAQRIVRVLVQNPAVLSPGILQKPFSNFPGR
jgi:UDP-hydrolysing UDP-N-acetyl-D-glucosamine 2-epimerase